MYSGLDPESPVGATLLKTQFVAKSWGDIRKKLEKIDDWQDRGLQELLREAQKVYVRRDEEKQRAKAKVLVAAVRECQKKEDNLPLREEQNSQRGRAAPINWMPRNRPQGRSASVNSVSVNTGQRESIPTCYYCGEKGHIQRVCLKREKDEKMFKDE